MSRPPPSLRGRALMWLAQREHSRAELRGKLRRWAAVPDAAPPDERAGRIAASDSDIDRLLDELEAGRQLSDARFVEGRVHAREGRFGNRRIQMELGCHGVRLDPDAAERLRDTELKRARDIQARKFGQPPATAQERARQVRFLAGRGFTAETIRRVVGTSGDDD